MARSLARRSQVDASVGKGTSPLWRCTGSGGTTTASPRASTAADVGGFGISGAQVARLKHELARQQILGVLGRQPATIFGDADGNDLVLFFIDCVENRCGREQ